MGREEAFTAFVVAHRDRLLRAAYLICGDASRAADHRGSRSGAFVERMLAAGLVFEEDDDRLENEAAALTFVENLTSVRLTVGLLDGLTLRTGLIENY